MVTITPELFEEFRKECMAPTKKPRRPGAVLTELQDRFLTWCEGKGVDLRAAEFKSKGAELRGILQNYGYEFTGNGSARRIYGWNWKAVSEAAVDRFSEIEERLTAIEERLHDVDMSVNVNSKWRNEIERAIRETRDAITQHRLEPHGEVAPPRPITGLRPDGLPPRYPQFKG